MTTWSETEFVAQRWLEHDFRKQRSHLDIHSSSPLFRMRCTDLELQRIRDILIKGDAALHSARRHTSALFCLFAAETLRREYDGGAWSWDIVSRRLGKRLDQATVANVTTAGLAYWQRDVRTDRRGRQFLRTLIVEGGLPRHLIESGNAGLLQFLRALLRDVEAYDLSSAEKVEVVAQQREYLLPSSWRNGDTFALAAELVLAVTGLRKQLSRDLSAGEAIRQLDAKDASWRDSLPVDLGDAAAMRLITSLVGASRGPKPQQKLESLCERMLVVDGETLSPRMCLAGSGLISDSFLPARIIADDDVRRIRVHLLDENGIGRPRAAAVLERSGELWKWVPIQVEPVAFAFDRTVRAQLVVDGNESGQIDLPGGEALPSSGPWIFEDDEDYADSGPALALQYVGSGSRDTRRARIFLAVDASEGEVKALEGTAAIAARLEGSARLLFEVDGAAIWQARQEPYRIRVRAKRAQVRSETFGLRLRLPSWQIEYPRTSLGAPVGRVVTAHRDPPQTLWRSVGDSGPWRRLDVRQGWPTGELDLALAKDEIVWDRTRILVLPEAARIKARWIGDRQTELDVIGFGDCAVSVDMTNVEVAVSISPVTDGQRVVVTWDGSPLSYITLRTRLLSAPRPVDVRHRIRVPFSKGFFTDAQGHLVPNNHRLRFTELDHIWAQSAGLEGRRSELMARMDVVRSGPCAGRRLASVTGFDNEMALSRSRRTLERLYATSATLDADVRLQVLTNGIEGGLLRVSTFERDVTVDAERQTCALRIDHGKPDDDVGTRLVAWSIGRPDEPPLELRETGRGQWAIPSEPGAGPWLILGQGDHSRRIRPRVVADEASIKGEAPLVTAVRIGDQTLRKSALRERLDAIASAPWSPEYMDDWSFLDRLSENAELRVPLLALDVFLEIARSPSILAAWLLRSGGRLRRRVVDMEDGLPFLWSLLPMSVWHATAMAAFHHFEGLTDNKDLARKIMMETLQEVSSYCPQANSGCWVAREALGLSHPEGEPNLPNLRTPAWQAVLRAQIGETLPLPAWQAKVEAERDWLNLEADVLSSSPVIAATFALNGQEPSPLMVPALRFCRDQGPDNFDSRFRCAVQLQLSQSTSL